MSLFDHVIITFVGLLCAVASYALGGFIGSASNSAFIFRIGLIGAVIFIIIAIVNWWL